MKKKEYKSAKKIKSLFSSSSHRKINRKAPGQPPGTAQHTGDKKVERMVITVHDYSESHYNMIPITEIEGSASYLSDGSRTWIQIQGLHDIEQLRKVWNYFDLHPLIQEDIVSVSQRPKVEPYKDVIFVVLRMVAPTEPGADELFRTEQVSLVLGSNYILSFQESLHPVFEPVIRRLALENTRMRTLEVDYLAYALMDNIVDHYFLALDMVGDTIEDLEEAVIERPKSDLLSSIHSMRRDLIFFRKSVWSLRDGINNLIRDESPLISSDVKVFLRDVYDHVVQVIDSVENQREMIFSLYDMYMSSLSNRMNEVMKVLTIMSTIFIPLTFIAGVYGMNFNTAAGGMNMPELNWSWGYPFSLGLMVVVAFGMILFFKRKGWL